MSRDKDINDDAAAILVNLISVAIAGFVIEASKVKVDTTILIELACALTIMIGVIAYLRRTI